MNSITDKTYCLITKHRIKIWINKDERDKILAMMSNSSQKTIIVNDNAIQTDGICIYTSDTMSNNDKINRGEWKCKYDYWHERNQQCGHNLIKKLDY